MCNLAIQATETIKFDLIWFELPYEVRAKKTTVLRDN